jgi:hypothetical protein
MRSGRGHSASRTARRMPRVASAIALVVGSTLAVGVAWAVHVGVRDQEHRLLTERANEVNLVFTSSTNVVSSSLAALGGILKATNGPDSQFDQAAAAEVGSGANQLTYALLRPTAGGFDVVAVQGEGLALGQTVSDARAPTLREALTSGTMIATPVVGQARFLGFAVGPPVAPAGMVLYRQSTLGRVSAPRQAGTAPFNELDVVLYATPHVDPQQVLVTTARTLPLRGSVRYQPVKVGATTWTLAVAARTSLVGSTAEAAPWGALGAGLVVAGLVAAVIEGEGRRRRSAVELYAGEHHVAETLQRSLLPELPSLPGLGLAARYVAGAAGQEVGGDWFDVFPIDGGRVGVVIGDVMGHDLVAAAAMSQIRAALRAFAWRGESPGSVLEQLDQFVTTFAMTPLVTVFYGVLGPPASDGSRMLRYANAGHLTPLVQTNDGEVQPLSGGGSVIVGGLLADGRGEAEAQITVGSTIVLFTDGLVETSGESLDDSLGRLALQISSERATGSVETLSDHVLAGTNAGELGDDVALLIVRVLASDSRGPARTNTRGATLTRAEPPTRASLGGDDPLDNEPDRPDVDKTGSGSVEGADRAEGIDGHVPGNLGLR